MLDMFTIKKQIIQRLNFKLLREKRQRLSIRPWPAKRGNPPSSHKSCCTKIKSLRREWGSCCTSFCWTCALPESNISPLKTSWDDTFPFPLVGYVSSLESIGKKSRNIYVCTKDYKKPFLLNFGLFQLGENVFWKSPKKRITWKSPTFQGQCQL